MNRWSALDTFALAFILLAIATLAATALYNFIDISQHVTPAQEHLYGSHLQAVFSIMGNSLHQWFRQHRSGN